MNPNNKVFRAAFIVFGFWWVVLTLYHLGTNIFFELPDVDLISQKASLWMIGVGTGFGVALWGIWYSRIKIMGALEKGEKFGVFSTLGEIPMLGHAPRRTDKPTQILPLNNEAVNAWIEKHKGSNPDHVALFLAIWDVLSAYKHLPATHRKGGHGNRTLWRHSEGVVETILEMAPSWQYDGVWIKKQGMKRTKYLEMRSTAYTFDPNDPVIAIAALAHDIGKTQVMWIDDQGVACSKEMVDEKTGLPVVMHDYIAAQMLARMPEFWKLPMADRRVLALAIAHYHRPAHLPIASDGKPFDDRVCAVMELLIKADRATGMKESNIEIDPSTGDAQDMTETQSEQLYNAFIKVVTEYGRINGTGDSDRDKAFMLGRKHDGLIIMKEGLMRQALLSELALTMDDTRDVTRQLMIILKQKGVLMEQSPDGIEHTGHRPIWTASFYNSKTGKPFPDYWHAIVIRPTSNNHELLPLVSLPDVPIKVNFALPAYPTVPVNAATPELGEARANLGFELSEAHARTEILASIKKEFEKEGKEMPVVGATPAPAAIASPETQPEVPATPTIDEDDPLAYIPGFDDGVVDTEFVDSPIITPIEPVESAEEKALVAEPDGIKVETSPVVSPAKAISSDLSETGAAALNAPGAVIQDKERKSKGVDSTKDADKKLAALANLAAQISNNTKDVKGSVVKKKRSNDQVKAEAVKVSPENEAKYIFSQAMNKIASGDLKVEGKAEGKVFILRSAIESAFPHSDVNNLIVYARLSKRKAGDVEFVGFPDASN